jgi:hypothetical protein
LALALENIPHPAYVPKLRGWSVQAVPGGTLFYLCQPLVQARVRTVALGTLLENGGRLAKTPGIHEHCTVVDIDPARFHEILSMPTRNPYGPK